MQKVAIGFKAIFMKKIENEIEISFTHDSVEHMRMAKFDPTIGQVIMSIYAHVNIIYILEINILKY